MAIVFPADRPKLVRNRCVMEMFGGVFVLSRCVLDFSVDVMAFVIGLSQIFPFSLSIAIRFLSLNDSISMLCTRRYLYIQVTFKTLINNYNALSCLL